MGDQGETRTTIDIPNVLLTETASVADLVARAEATWSVRAESIVYPGTWISGLTTVTDPLFAVESDRPGQPLDDVVGLCEARGWRLWLNVDLDLKPVRSDLVHVKGFFGGSSSQACINVPATAQALSRILQELRRVTGASGAGPLIGVVFSIQELWPISGEEVLRLTCFCRACRQAFEAADPGLLAHFQRTPNPWDLALKHTAAGIDHLDALTPDTTPPELVALSQSGGFYAATALRSSTEREHTERHLLHWADLVLHYIRVRHQITMDALARIAELVKATLGVETRVAAAISEFPYDWLAGTFRAGLAQTPPVDELWIDPGNADDGLQGVPYRFYLWERSRYYVLNFFQALEASISERQRSLHDLSPRELRAGAEGAARALLSTSMAAPISRELLPDPPAADCRGLVLVPLYRDNVEALVDRFTPRPGPAPDAKGSQRA
jgi:hypothetical protein